MVYELVNYFISSELSSILGEYYTYKVSAILSCAIPCILLGSMCFFFFFILAAIFRGFFKC